MATRWRRLLVSVAALVAAIGLVLRVDLGALPEVTRFRDDAYYYFAFVRNLVGGHGPCVSPGVPTSGVHALWAALLCPLYWLFGDRGLVVGAQHLGLGLHVLTAAGLWALLGRRLRATLVALLYLGTPTLIVEAQNGQETALACLATAGLWWGFGRSVGLASATAVFAVLARSDLVFLVLAFGVARFGVAARAIVPAVAAVAVYAATDLTLAGRWLQDSASPIPWLFAAHFEATDPDLAARLHRWWWYLRPCLLGGPYAVVSPVFGGVLTASALAAWLRPRWHKVPLVITLIGAALGASDVAVPLIGSLLLLLWGPARNPNSVYPAALLGFGSIVALHLLVRTYPRDYYFAPLGVLSALAFGGLSARNVLVAGALLAGSSVVQWFEPPFVQTWQEQMAMAGHYLRAVVPVDEPVGCFNSGIVTFHDRGLVLNLDGVVNHDAYLALRADALSEYLDRHEVRFVVDSPEQLAVAGPWPHSSGSHFGRGFDPARDLVEVARFVVPGIGGTPFCVYWRRGRGEAPVRPSARILGAAPPVAGHPAGVYVLWPTGGAARLELSPMAPSGALATVARRTLVTVEHATTVVLRVEAANSGRYGLFVDGAADPVLVVDL